MTSANQRKLITKAMVIEDIGDGGNDCGGGGSGGGCGGVMDDAMNILDVALNQAVESKIELLQRMEEENSDDIGFVEDVVKVSTY